MTPLDILTALPPIVAGFIGLLAPLCIAVILWAVLPRRNADIDRQIDTLRKSADHSVSTRPRVRAGGYQPIGSVGPVKAPPRAPGKPCGGGMCRKRMDCPDQHCPGKVEARLAARSCASSH